MHEFSIAESLIEIVQSVSEKEGMNPVEVVHLRIGRLSGIQAEALLLAYQLVTQETPLEGSRLEIQEVEPRAVCRDCGHEFDFPEDFFCCCPQCDSVRIDIKQGREMVVDSLEGEVANGD